MRFSLSRNGQLQDQMLILNEQLVFDKSGSVNEIKDEMTLTLNLDSPGRTVSSHTATEILFQFLATKKNKLSLSMLVGMSKTIYTLDGERFNGFFEITKERVDKDYKYMTWFDATMLLLITQRFEKSSNIYLWSKNHIEAIVRKDENIIPILKSLQNNKVAPVY